MITVISIFITVLFGYSIVKRINSQAGLLELIGSGFLLGLGIETIILFVYFAMFDNVNLSFFYIFKFVEFIISCFILVNNLNIKCNKSVKFNLVFIAWFAAICLFLISLVYAFYNPVWTTDSLYYFDFRAKIMYLSGKVSEISIIPGWSYYPMFTSMIGLISRLSGNENPSFYYPLMFLSFAFIFYSCLRRYMNNTLSSIFTLLMYSTPLIYWQSRLDGMTNLPYSIFISASILYAFVFIKEKRMAFAMFGIVFAGLSRWVRIQEPFWVIPVFIILGYLVYARKFKEVILLSLIFVVLINVWPLYIRFTSQSLGGVNTTVSFVKATSSLVSNSNAPHFYERFFEISFYLIRVGFRHLFPVIQIFLFFIPITIFMKKKEKQEIFSLVVIFLLAGLLLVSIFYSTFVWDWMVKLENSLSRLLSFFVPLMWFYISLVVNRLIGLTRRK